MTKKLMSRVVAVMLSAAMALSFAGCGKSSDSKVDQIKKDKKVVMGTNAEFPPFEFKNDKGDVDGFDAAIAKEISKELGVDLKIEDMAFDSLIGALKSGKIDFAAAGMSVTEDRKQNVDFSKEYYTASQKIIVKKDNSDIKGKDDLKGKKIGVQEGTTGDTEASKIADVKMSRFKKAIDAIQDLKNGKIDAVVLDASPSEVFVSKNADLKILDQQLTDEAYAIAVNKGNKDLVDVINKVIDNLKKSGKYDELVKQYIGE